MCRDDYPPYEAVENHPDQMTLGDALAAVDTQPAERVKCGYPECRFYATCAFAGPHGEQEPRCDSHATAKVQAAAAALGFRALPRRGAHL